MQFGDRLKACRKNLNITQMQLAKDLGVNQRDVSKWENCERTPNLENFVKLCKILKVSSDELLGLKK